MDFSDRDSVIEFSSLFSIIGLAYVEATSKEAVKHTVSKNMVCN